MLGYTVEDLYKMIEALGDVLDSKIDKTNVKMTLDFLQGLWAEGYFD